MNMFKKYEGNPIFGSKEKGTFFDAYVWKDENANKKYRMDFSHRKEASLAVSFSDDGIHWEDPQITLAPDPSCGWEERVNRNCVLKVDNLYRMWYTGQARGHSYIGYAESEDGLHFHRRYAEPIVISEYPWEGDSVMNPCILYENGLYRMWYSAGDTYEPNVIAYAESQDGVNWKKWRANPVVVAEQNNYFEKDRIGGCCVCKTEDMGYLMFYIGYEDINTARICVAQSENGIFGWKRSASNPLVSPTHDSWERDACYKPAALWEEGIGWRIWYNGRHGHDEFIGLALCPDYNIMK